MDLPTLLPWSFIIPISLLFLATTTLTLLTLTNNKPRRLPPGPPTLPLFGNLFQLSAAQPHKAITRLAAAYGPIMTLKLGSIPTIVISSSALAKHALILDADHFSTPFKIDAVYAHQHDHLSVGWLPASSPLWRLLRRIWASHLVGGRKLDAMTPYRRRMVSELLEVLRARAEEGAAVDVGRAALHAFFKIMLATNFSKDLERAGFGKTAAEIEEMITEIIGLTRTPNVVDCFPALHALDPQRIRSRLTAKCAALFRVFDQLIDTRMETRRSSKESSSSSSYLRCDDALESLLDIMEEQKEEDIDRSILLHLLMDVIGLGMDTTMRSVEWSMAELLRNPQILHKCRQELENAVGKAKPVEEADVGKLPYLQAVLQETLRVHPPAPFLLPRIIKEGVDIGGFTVPKGARVLFNVWAIGRDPERWPDPEAFLPERFLDSGHDLRGQSCDMIPFGAGRRICPGLSMALRMVPAVLGSMINCFDWEIEGGVNPKDLDMEDVVMITLGRAKPLRAIPILRV